MGRQENAAFRKAQKAIAKAKTSGAVELDLSSFRGFNNLDRLPEEIGDLTGLTTLNLWGTKISDISALAGLTGLTALDLAETQVSDIKVLAGLTRLSSLVLWNTRVSDISVLEGLTRLSNLALWNTRVTDISVLARLTQLTSLFLSGKQVSDISILAGLTGLDNLNLSGTQVSDISVLAGLTGLISLDLERTRVSDISVLAGLTKLQDLRLDGAPVMDLRPVTALAEAFAQAGPMPWEGLHFADTEATRRDPKIAEIAAIKDNPARARALFDYLKDWVPPVDVEAMPAQVASGLRYQVGQDGRLGYVSSSQTGTPTPDLGALHGLLVEDCGDMLLRFAVGQGQEFEPLGNKLRRYRASLGAEVSAISPVVMWKVGNDLRNLSRANRDRFGNSLGEMPYFGADLSASLDGLIATHNVFAAKHPELAALDLAQIDPVDRQRAEANRALMEGFIAAIELQGRLIIDEVGQDLRDLHEEALLHTQAGLRALAIEEDSLRNLITEVVTQALLAQRAGGALSTVGGDIRAGVIGGAAFEAVVRGAPAVASAYPELTAVLQPYIGAILSTWDGGPRFGRRWTGSCSPSSAALDPLSWHTPPPPHRAVP